MKNDETAKVTYLKLSNCEKRTLFDRRNLQAAVPMR